MIDLGQFCQSCECLGIIDAQLELERPCDEASNVREPVQGECGGEQTLRDAVHERQHPSRRSSLSFASSVPPGARR